MDKVVVLARVSTQAQDYQRQVIELMEYCDRVGWEVSRVFANKVSGAKTLEDRSEIVEMVEYIKSNDVKRVVCLEISRLGRNTLEALKVINYLNENGGHIRKCAAYHRSLFLHRAHIPYQRRPSPIPNFSNCQKKESIARTECL